MELKSMNKENIGLVGDIELTKMIIKFTKHLDIDIEETISRTMDAGWLNEDYFVLGWNGATLPRLFELNGFEYDPFEETYWDGFNHLVDDMGVYIVLAFATEGAGSSHTYTYDVDGLSDAEIYSANISTWRHDVNFEFPKDSPATRNIDERDDYGILLTRDEGKLEINYAYNEFNPAGPCGYKSIREIEDELENPVFRLVIFLMLDAIVLKDKSTGLELLSKMIKELSNE